MKAILILSFLILLSSTVDGQQWPRAEQNEQHHINGTVGESRDEAGDDRRWHKGCDVRLRPAGMPVLAIEDGVFNRVNYFEVCVGSYCHTHVIPDPRFMDGDPIVAGETIGHTQNIGEPHIHLQQSNADTENVTGNAYKNDAIEWINALHNLIPFTDVVDPVINNMTLWRHGMNNIGITGPLCWFRFDSEIFKWIV